MRTGLFLSFALGVLLQYGCNKKDDTPGTVTDADFSIAGFEAAAPCTITFINTSANATSYLWNFGDGTTSALSNPTHTYALNGSYQLSLRATGPTGADSVCKLVAIEPAVTPNRSAFSYFFNRCSGYPVGALFKTVNPASTNIVWDFGAGLVKTERDPIIQFLGPGDYTIKYSSQLNGVRDTVVRVIRIQ
jgi:PKD repeat protein